MNALVHKITRRSEASSERSERAPDNRITAIESDRSELSCQRRLASRQSFDGFLIGNLQGLTRQVFQKDKIPTETDD